VSACIQPCGPQSPPLYIDSLPHLAVPVSQGEPVHHLLKRRQRRSRSRSRRRQPWRFCVVGLAQCVSGTRAARAAMDTHSLESHREKTPSAAAAPAAPRRPAAKTPGGPTPGSARCCASARTLCISFCVRVRPDQGMLGACARQNPQTGHWCKPPTPCMVARHKNGPQEGVELVGRAEAAEGAPQQGVLHGAQQLVDHLLCVCV